jgi:hypothetical protein
VSGEPSRSTDAFGPPGWDMHVVSINWLAEIAENDRRPTVSD